MSIQYSKGNRICTHPHSSICLRSNTQKPNKKYPSIFKNYFVTSLEGYPLSFLKSVSSLPPHWLIVRWLLFSTKGVWISIATFMDSYRSGYGKSSRCFINIYSSVNLNLIVSITHKDIFKKEGSNSLN